MKFFILLLCLVLLNKNNTFAQTNDTIITKFPKTFTLIQESDSGDLEITIDGKEKPGKYIMLTIQFVNPADTRSASASINCDDTNCISVITLYIRKNVCYYKDGMIWCMIENSSQTDGIEKSTLYSIYVIDPKNTKSLSMLAEGLLVDIQMKDPNKVDTKRFVFSKQSAERIGFELGTN